MILGREDELHAIRTVAALAVMALPGVPLAVLWRPRRDVGVMLGVVGMTAASVWIVLFWTLRWLPFGLTSLTWGVGGAALLGTMALRRRLPGRGGGVLRRGWPVLAVFLAVLILRLVPYAVAPVAPGADMSMHSALARLIASADGIPSTYRPYLPVDGFASLPVGFPVLAALLSRLAGLPPVRAAFLLACLVHAAVTVAVYVLLRHRFGWRVSLAVAVLVSFGNRDLQAIFLWGGAPTVLSFVLMMGALPVLLGRDLRPSLTRAGSAGLLVAGAVLAHPVLPFAMALVVPVVAAGVFVRGGWERAEPMVRTGVMTAAVALACILPFLLGPRVRPSSAELAWIHRWQLVPVHVPHGHGWGHLADVLPYLTRRLGPILVFWTAAAAWLAAATRRRFPWRELGLGVGSVVLVFNAYDWVLPFSWLLYPDRIVLLTLVPAAFLLAVGARGVRALDRRARVRRLQPAFRSSLLLPLILVSVALPFARWYLFGIRHVTVTRDDLAAMRWIEEQSRPDEVIGTNYGDAGPWIPAMIGRAVTSPHYHILYADELKAWRRGIVPRIVFVGSKRVYDGIRYTRSGLLAAPDFRLVYSKGGAAVFLRRRTEDGVGEPGSVVSSTSRR